MVDNPFDIYKKEFSYGSRHLGGGSFTYTRQGRVMNYYFAPLEGITGYIYRNTYEKHFGGIQKYFSPFITTNQHFAIQNRDKKDVLPENNKEIYLVPQILTNNAEQFIDMTKKLQEMGYEEVNLNLGCPSKTVVTKKKGAGFLADPEALNIFLAEIFNYIKDMNISIKTRIGMEKPQEFERLIQIYNKYPLKELIVHPRLQTDYYKNHPNMEVFEVAIEKSKVPVCYNGDLFTIEDIKKLKKEYPAVENIMLGRGILKTPSLLKELQGEKRDLGKWQEFLSELCDEYQKEFSGDTNVLYKMKEHWYYLFQSLPNSEKAAKAMRKVKNLDDYRILVKSILRG